MLHEHLVDTIKWMFFYEKKKEFVSVNTHGRYLTEIMSI